MIVLDEHLGTRKIMDAIRTWYTGKVVSVLELRPKTVIKDEAIAALLSHRLHAAFVTINVADFWQRVAVNQRFCVICVNVAHKDVLRVPSILKLLFRNSRFRSKRQRAGHVFRVNLDQHVNSIDMTTLICRLFSCKLGQKFAGPPQSGS